MEKQDEYGVYGVKEERKGKGITSFPTNIENPFLDKMNWTDFMVYKDVRRRRSVENVEVVDTESGESKGPVYYTDLQKELIDSRTYTVVYDKVNAIFKDLSSPELGVLMYIFNAIYLNQDIVMMNYDDCLRFTGYKTTAPVYTGLVGLMGKGVIARHFGSAAMFFINPKYFYKGNAVNLYVKYLLDKKSKKKQ